MLLRDSLLAHLSKFHDKARVRGIVPTHDSISAFRRITEPSPPPDANILPSGLTATLDTCVSSPTIWYIADFPIHRNIGSGRPLANPSLVQSRLTHCGAVMPLA